MKNVFITLAVVAVVGLGVWAYYFSDGTKSPFNRTQATPTSISTVETSGGVADVVAVVNGEKISRVDFETLQAQLIAQQGIDTTKLDAAAKTQLATEVINFAISQTLLRQAALASGISATPAEIDTQIATVKGQFETPAIYEETLAKEGLTEDALRARLAMELVMQKYLERELKLSTIEATDAEITAVYTEASASDATVPPLEEVRDQVKVAVIQQKQQGVIAQHAQALRAKAQVEINL